ncbi:MAG TPA: homoserine O-acetyltransferase [Acidimicrobiales bacterium]
MTPRSIAGTWQPGDDPGHRQFARLVERDQPGFTLESGNVLSELTVAYETWGELNGSRSNAVLVSHALTGDSHAIGPKGPGHPTVGWWEGLIGPGLAIDSDLFYVVCPNVLGGCQGTTGPSSVAPDGHPYGPRFPLITIRDQVAAEVALVDHLGITKWFSVIGGSMGGMRSLEWSVGYPERVERAVVLAVGAAASAEQIALCSLQIRAIETDPTFANGYYYETDDRPDEGLNIARGIGQLSYRTAQEFDLRFGRTAQGDEDPLRGGRYAVESYLEYQGDKLSARFDANSYITLSRAMNSHDVGRGRGGVESALRSVRANVTVIGIASDRLYPLSQQQEISEYLPGDDKLHVIDSITGHDGFLLEIDAIGKIVKDSLQL